MSKLTKLIHSPKLFIKDALQKRLYSPPVDQNKKVQEIPLKLIKASYLEQNFKHDITKVKLNLIIVDDISEQIKFKDGLIRFQLRSIDKYTSFDSVSYISESIRSNNQLIKVYKTYQNFYESKVINISPRREIFVFINLTFLFLRKTSINDFIDDSGLPITYIKNKGIVRRVDDVERSLRICFNNYEYQYTPMENYCCVDNANLMHLYPIMKNISQLKDYVFEFLPVANSALIKNLVNTPIQFARLNSGYMEKFIWLQTVHGSKKCPLGVTFNNITSDTRDYAKFLNNIVPHKSKIESFITT